jgi:hypothetical protein
VYAFKNAFLKSQKLNDQLFFFSDRWSRKPGEFKWRPAMEIL